MRSGLVVVCMVVLGSVGCLDSTSVTCKDGRVCPTNAVCDDIHGGCATSEQVVGCAGQPELAACSYPGVDDGACFDGVCLPGGCGNGIVTPPEVCDDGNTDHDDGCSADCLSNEMCGNGAVDSAIGEACDPTAGTGDPCRENCTIPRCGDAIVDAGNGESCDLGTMNSEAPDAMCRVNCQERRCGDHIVDTASELATSAGGGLLQRRGRAAAPSSRLI